MQNLDNHRMNSGDKGNTGGYEASEMYGFVHNTILPNLRNSGLNITDCDLVSNAVYYDILRKTGMTSAAIAGGEYFWLADPDSSAHNFYAVREDGQVITGPNYANGSLGVRPLITITVK